MKRSILALLLLSMAVCAAAQWHVTRTIRVPGEGGWDYLTLDVQSQRLYVTRSTRVQVLQLGSGALVGEIPNTPGVHGVALAPALHRGFTSNGTADSVTVFDTQTLKTLQHVSVGHKPDAIVYDAFTNRVFTMNGMSGDCTAIDAPTGRVVGTVSLGGQPEFAVVDGSGHLWVNLEDTGEVAEVDTQALNLMGHWTLAPGEGPTGLSIDAEHHKLYSGCHNRKLVVFDTQQHQVLDVLPLGKGVDATAVDPALGEAFSSNGDGTLTVVDTHALKVAETVPTRAGARTMALDPVHHRIYTCTAQRLTGRQFAPGSFVVLEVTR